MDIFVGLSRVVDSWLPSRRFWTFCPNWNPQHMFYMSSKWPHEFDFRRAGYFWAGCQVFYLILTKISLKIIGIPDMNFWSRSQNSSRRYLTTQEPLEKNQFQVLLTSSALHMTRGHQWSVRRLIKNFSKFSKIEMNTNLREMEETLELYKTSNFKYSKVKLKFA